ncbi:orotidine 5'-phosphate decarboxylase [Listeria floridensis FSL S10-1187]|uniref:Orotidine 5'-phosphate decarboxylase n=1 Tax=Listeria floridensis FSL S10-1187 TaxID=1265817 RepID=A0ABP3B151_9LIST|nr:orotidine-5'-phosphate decarboxylase [Listeria floridensis]EUJ33028.1 orotidine 5'-phosphate decarboxylase [Listeria floridensis FSL S10-1187]
MTDPIIALDFPSAHEAEAFLSRFQNQKLALKVGMELFYAEGPEFVLRLKEQGHFVFLDLKLHDIPNTVERAMTSLARLGVDLVNVHAAGGKKMMEAALRGLEAGSKTSGMRPKLIAVTQLTSTSEAEMQQEQLIPVPLEESVLHYSKLAEQAGLDGVVCSSLEASAIKQHTRADFLCVTPGIRMSADSSDDQKRVVTPREARDRKASAIVVGRPITRAENPKEAYEEVTKEWNK